MVPQADPTNGSHGARPSAAKITLFFDGACPLCRREANHYKKAKGHEALAFVDIAAEDFDAAEHGLDAKAVHRTIHAKTAAGKVRVGIDAFALVWQELPRYRPLVVLTRTPGVRQLMLLGYAAFAKVRPRLPGRSCTSKACAPG